DRMDRGGWWLLALGFVASLLAWLALDSGAQAPPPPAAVATAVPAAQVRPEASAPAPFSVAGAQVREAERAAWLARLALAQQTFAAYRDATRYPRSSQPLALHADQASLNALVEEDLPLAGAKGGEAVSLRTSQ